MRFLRLAMYLLLVTLHLLAAVTWVGGMAFLALVGVPVLRRVEPEALRTRLFEEIGLRLRAVGWTAVVILLVTGTGLLHLRGWLTLLADGAFLQTTVGQALAWKLGLVAVMIVLTLVHDVAFSPDRMRAMSADPRRVHWRRWLVLSGRLAMLAAIGVVIAAVRVVRG